MSHSDPESVRKSVRSYMTVFGMLLVFTVITVAVSRFHFAVPIAITVALIIAIMKGSMVAGVFMHLSNEKQREAGHLRDPAPHGRVFHRPDVHPAVLDDGPHRHAAPSALICR
jgi:caa(3)-type oxidase subunit IV